MAYFLFFVNKVSFQLSLIFFEEHLCQARSLSLGNRSGTIGTQEKQEQCIYFSNLEYWKIPKKFSVHNINHPSSNPTSSLLPSQGPDRRGKVTEVKTYKPAVLLKVICCQLKTEA